MGILTVPEKNYEVPNEHEGGRDPAFTVPAVLATHFTAMISPEFCRLTFSEGQGEDSFPRFATVISRSTLGELVDMLTQVRDRMDDVRSDGQAIQNSQVGD